MSEGELAARLDRATAGLEGPELLEAVRRLGEGLGEEERAELGRLLLERARSRACFDYGLIRRIQDPYLELLRPRRVEPASGPPRARRRRRG